MKEITPEMSEPGRNRPMPHKFPTQLFVKIEIDPNDKTASWFSASDTLAGAMSDTDGPEMVGVYQRVKTTRVEKVIQVA